MAKTAKRKKSKTTAPRTTIEMLNAKERAKKSDLLNFPKPATCRACGCGSLEHNVEQDKDGNDSCAYWTCDHCGCIHKPLGAPSAWTVGNKLVPFEEPRKCRYCRNDSTPMLFHQIFKAWICQNCGSAHHENDQLVLPMECPESDLRREFAKEFLEPYACNQCGSQSLYIASASVNGEAVMAWICDSCGYAHLPPKQKTYNDTAIRPKDRRELEQALEEMACNHLGVVDDKVRGLGADLLRKVLLQFRPDLFNND